MVSVDIRLTVYVFGRMDAGQDFQHQDRILKIDGIVSVDNSFEANGWEIIPPMSWLNLGSTDLFDAAY